VAGLRLHRSTIAACFVFSRKISRTAFWEFCTDLLLAELDVRLRHDCLPLRRLAIRDSVLLTRISARANHDGPAEERTGTTIFIGLISTREVFPKWHPFGYCVEGSRLRLPQSFNAGFAISSRTIDSTAVSDKHAVPAKAAGLAEPCIDAGWVLTSPIDPYRHDAMLPNTPSRRIRPWKSAAPKCARKVAKNR
jgi:hypothetical protein